MAMETKPANSTTNRLHSHPHFYHFKTTTFLLPYSQTIKKHNMSTQKTPPDVGIQMPEAKIAGAQSTTINGASLVTIKGNRKIDMIYVIIRLVCLVSSLVAVSMMVTAEQKSIVSIYGFDLPVYSKWSFSYSFEYLAGIAAATAAHSLLQFILSGVKLLKKSLLITSRNHAWLIFICDQVFAYVMMSAGSAASGVTNMNHTGIRLIPLPNFCKPLHKFCERIAISIVFTFFSCFLLATLAILDVIWISKY